jgi:hypothetical protein
MAKIRPAGKKKKDAVSSSTARAVPCVVFLALALILFSLLFYLIMKSA